MNNKDFVTGIVWATLINILPTTPPFVIAGQNTFLIIHKSYTQLVLFEVLQQINKP